MRIPTVALAGKIWSAENCASHLQGELNCAILSSGHASAAQLPEGGQTGQEEMTGVSWPSSPVPRAVNWALATQRNLFGSKGCRHRCSLKTMV